MERLSACLDCVREGKYSWSEIFLFGTLLVGGGLAWLIGAIAGKTHASHSFLRSVCQFYLVNTPRQGIRKVGDTLKDLPTDALHDCIIA